MWRSKLEGIQGALGLKKLVEVLFFPLCLLVFFVQMTEAQNRVTHISGRVVDLAHRPIENVIVTFHPVPQDSDSLESVGGTFVEYRTGLDGRFRLPSSAPQAERAVLIQ
jgi:hypothetical protein